MQIPGTHWHGHAHALFLSLSVWSDYHLPVCSTHICSDYSPFARTTPRLLGLLTYICSTTSRLLGLRPRRIVSVVVRATGEVGTGRGRTRSQTIEIGTGRSRPDR